MWKSIVGEQVQESILLRFQFLELAADCCVKFGDAALFLGQRIVEELADVVDKVRRQIQRRIVVDDRLLHFVCG